MKNVQLSKRLGAVASFVEKGARVCDIGTDHGFVPIYLINSGTASHVVAMDVGEGPLERAREHVRKQELCDKIELRLSNGLEKLGKDEADTMICAGMGGTLMMRIINDKDPWKLGIRHMILQPQSDLFLFRENLQKIGYGIVAEKEIFEEGKYYVVINAVHGEEDVYYKKAASMLKSKHELTDDDCIRICRRFGPYLICTGDSELKNYLEHELSICEKILLKLSENAHPDRERDIIMKKHDITCALDLL